MFKKENDLILKITNLVLLIGLIASLAIFYSTIIHFVIQSPTMNTEEYKAAGCPTYSGDFYYSEQYSAKIPNEGTITEEQCKENFVLFEKSVEDIEFNNKKAIVLAGGAVVIVAFVIYFLNRKKED